MKKEIKVFVYYAKRNKTANEQFMALLGDYAGADAHFGESALTGRDDE